MTQPVYTCPVHQTGMMTNEQLERCTTNLATGPRPGLPFALSYDLHFYDGYVFAQPICQIWVEDEGVVHGFRTNDRPDLFRHYAPQIFSFLEMESLRDTFWSALNNALPEGSGELFHACVTAHGVILIAEQARWVEMNYKVNPIMGLIPEGLSNHARVAHFAGLKACATALMAAQSTGGSDAPAPDIRVEQA